VGSGSLSAIAARPSDPDADSERAGIEDALVRAGGVVAKAAAEMGLSRQALYRRMERLGIVMERRPK
jgi:transcriptional regulator of acetoin/glycerol metabolism